MTEGKINVRNQKPKKITVALETLGCKVNQAESEQLARQLIEAGYHLVPANEPADVYILNTCTVTGMADSKARHRLRMVHRRQPDAVLVATGCYAERTAIELNLIEGVSLIVRNEDKSRLVQILDESGLVPSPASLSGQSEVSLRELRTGTGRTRAFIKVQDGCNNFCSYCIVPLVRNREKSMPPEQVVKEILLRETDGYKEVVVTGVEVGSYRYEGLNIKGLLDRILSQTGAPRIRLSSLQPAEITEELLGIWQNPRMCRHFHLSLQSGSDGVLRRMNRRYATAEYRKAADLIRALVPDAAITTDVIIGFPGETDEEFRESFEFCKKMEFARIHVFPFSPRKGTVANSLPDQIDARTKKMRMEKMLALADDCVNNFSRKFKDRVLSVLFEQKDGNCWSGLTDNYIRVYADAHKDLTNQIAAVKIGEEWREGVLGKIVGNGT